MYKALEHLAWQVGIPGETFRRLAELIRDRGQACGYVWIQPEPDYRSSSILVDCELYPASLTPEHLTENLAEIDRLEVAIAQLEDEVADLNREIYSYRTRL